MFLAPSDNRVPPRALLAAALLALCAGSLLWAVSSSTAHRASVARTVTRPAWLPKMTVTEYFPARESWFAGRRVSTPGVRGRKSRIDWLYSAVGMSMEGDGLGTDGKRYHIYKVGKGGWIGRDGKKADWGSSNRKRSPFWREWGYWRNAKKGVTFPLDDGTWYAGVGKKYVKPKGVSFKRGPSLPLRYYRSVATDTSFIPRGSLVWVGAYKARNGDGWFRADDTGGAVRGRHIDVYRKPPRWPGDATTRRNQRLYVVPKGKIAAYVKRERRSDTDGLPLPPKSLY